MRRGAGPALRRIGGLAASLGALAVCLDPRAMQALLSLLFPAEAALLYPLAAPAALFFQHAALAVGASLAAALIGFGAGLLSHLAGLGLAEDEGLGALLLRAGTLAQTLPPVAVLALLVPFLGFGTRPVLVALALYGILPVLHGTSAGLASVPPEAVDAARGLGMGRFRLLLGIELPLALPAIVAGLRSSMVINVGTAALGAAMGAGGLGRPIMAGLVQFRTSYVVQGAFSSAVLALLLDGALSRFGRASARASATAYNSAAGDASITD